MAIICSTCHLLSLLASSFECSLIGREGRAGEDDIALAAETTQALSNKCSVVWFACDHLPSALRCRALIFYCRSPIFLDRAIKRPKENHGVLKELAFCQ